MSDGEILQSAPYHELLSKSQEFKDLVNAHKETAGSERLAHVNPVEQHGISVKEIKKCYTEKQFNASRRDQLIKQEEREIGDIGFKPYKQYLNQKKGYLYFSFGVVAHLTVVIGQILQYSWIAANVDNHHVNTLKLIAVYMLIGSFLMIILLLRFLCTVYMCIESSKSLFSQLLNSIFRSPMSFYDSTPMGRILSRVCI